MADYIKREAAIKAVEHAWSKRLEPTQYIEIIPSADVAPVRHGNWQFPIFEDGDINDPRCKCSECGSIEEPLARHNYCPNCGAKMDLEEE